MTNTLDIDDVVLRFSIASRELFNNFFHVESPYENNGWDAEKRFSDIQQVMFQKMVIEPTGLPESAYGAPAEGLVVVLRNVKNAPAMINRDIDSGYWDSPIAELTDDARLTFVGFFDWDQLEYRDHEYVRVRIDRWLQQPTATGKHALIQRRLVRFQRSAPTDRLPGT